MHAGRQLVQARPAGFAPLEVESDGTPPPAHSGTRRAALWLLGLGILGGIIYGIYDAADGGSSPTPAPTPKPSGTPVPTPKPSGTPAPTPKPSGTPAPPPVHHLHSAWDHHPHGALANKTSDHALSSAEHTALGLRCQAPGPDSITVPQMHDTPPSDGDVPQPPIGGAATRAGRADVDAERATRERSERRHPRARGDGHRREGKSDAPQTVASR